MYRPIDSPAIRYMFTSFMRGELHLANITVEVTQNPMVAVRQGYNVEIIAYLIESPVHRLQASEGPWESLARFYPDEEFRIIRVYFAEPGVAIIRELNRYKEYVL